MARQFKQFSASESEQGLFSGWASRYDEVDSYNDVVKAGAFDETFRENGGQIVILSDHDVTKSVGLGRMSLRPEGLWIDAKFSLELQDGRDAYIRVRDLKKSGLSIGYETLGERVRSGVRELTRIKLFEISVVQIPALDSARIASVKSSSSFEAAFDALSRNIREATTHVKAAQLYSKMQRVQSLHLQGRTIAAEFLMIEVRSELDQLDS